MRTLLHTSRSRGRSIAAATLGALALIGSLIVATPAQALGDTGSGGIFTPTTGRILDTKTGTGGFSTPMVANEWRTVKVAGLAGVPDDGTVGAVSLIATVADIPEQAILYGRPDASQATTSMGIYGGIDNDNTSFSSVLAVSSDGTIQVRTQNAVRLILDVQGYYSANTDGTAPGGFVPLNGKRIVDTRTGLGAAKATVAGGKTLSVQVSGTAGVPAGASGAIVNLIAINTMDKVGYLTPYAADATRPTNSLNYASATTTSMQAQVALSADGKINVYNATSTINFVVDVQGYFTASGKVGSSFTPAHGKVFDSREAENTIVGKNETRAISIAGQAGVPVMGSGLTAVVLSLTVAHGGGQNGGYARVWANGSAEPDTSAISYDYDTIRTNTITVPIGANGKINLHNIGEATHYVLDVQGWYASPLQPSIECDGGLTNGKWLESTPSEEISCTVSASAATYSDEPLRIVVDGSESVYYLSDSDVTSETVQVSTELGRHSLTATRGLTRTSTFSFGIGDWATASFGMTASNPESDGQFSRMTIYGDGSIFPDDASYRFFVLNPDKSIAEASPIVTAAPGAGTGEWEASEQGLDPDVNYTWYATVTGSKRDGVDRTPVTLTSPESPLATTPKDAEGALTESENETGGMSIRLQKCNFYIKSDDIHISSTAQSNGKPTASVHGWWTNVNCKNPGKATVKTRIQQKQSGIWRTVGTEGSKKVYSTVTGGSANRSNGRYNCKSSKTSTLRAVVVVDVTNVEEVTDTRVGGETKKACS